MNSLEELINKEIEALKNIPLDGAMDQAVGLIYERIHKNKGKMVVSGVGKAGHIGYQLSTTLCSTGTASCFLNPLEAQHGDLGILQKNDVLFAISNSGQTREMIEMVALSKKLVSDIKLILLTKNAESPLARGADVVFLTGDTQEICPLSLTPTTSTTVMKVISDLLVISLMRKINFTKEEYSLRHHGGYLGKKSKGC